MIRALLIFGILAAPLRAQQPTPSPTPSPEASPSLSSIAVPVAQSHAAGSNDA